MVYLYIYITQIIQLLSIFMGKDNLGIRKSAEIEMLPNELPLHIIEPCIIIPMHAIVLRNFFMACFPW